MNDRTPSRTAGVSFGSLLALVFIGLKLTGVIDWSWWWVLSPLWIGACIALLIVAGLAIALVVMRRPRHSTRNTPAREGGDKR